VPRKKKNPGPWTGVSFKVSELRQMGRIAARLTRMRCGAALSTAWLATIVPRAFRPAALGLKLIQLIGDFA
jgi:hypothetical protein